VAALFSCLPRNLNRTFGGSYGGFPSSSGYLRMRANTVGDVVRLLIVKVIVYRVPMGKRAHPRYELTDLGKTFKGLLIGAKVVSHGRFVTFQLAEVAMPTWIPSTFHMKSKEPRHRWRS
jgi:hypothetical protein